MEAPLAHKNKPSNGLATLIQANKETIIYYTYCTESLGSVESVEDFKLNSRMLLGLGLDLLRHKRQPFMYNV